MLCLMRTQGVTNATLDSLIRHMTSQLQTMSWSIANVPPDSAVDRARGVCATAFLRSDFDVCCMVDYDVQWEVGDLEYIATKAHEHKALVGGMVSKKASGQGFGGRFRDDTPHEMYSDELVELPKHSYVGGAFVAFSRNVLESIIEQGIPYCDEQGFYPFFLPVVIPNQKGTGYDYLSEDWAFNHYIREAGCKVFAAMAPVTVHHGRAAYSVIDGNMGRPT